jgi:hypothetical protein
LSPRRTELNASSTSHVHHIVLPACTCSPYNSPCLSDCLAQVFGFRV